MKMPQPSATGPNTANDETLPELFVALRGMLLAYAAKLVVVHDDAAHFYVNCRHADAKGKAQFFGAVKVSGRTCSFHFMPVYDFPALLVDISPGLKKRMQGKSCFTFAACDKALLHDLQLLVAQGARCYTAAGRL